jgi:hypothetical protein
LDIPVAAGDMAWKGVGYASFEVGLSRFGIRNTVAIDKQLSFRAGVSSPTIPSMRPTERNFVR